ncbi:hypothetical protein GOBAR_DD31015 [Gossypium barbadense]|nr:hypothetical protein GOBAR_DD31015 [Gossypium barbadense]
MSSRPELQAPPEIFYDDVEARKYTSSSRIAEIQVHFAVIFPFILCIILLASAFIRFRELSSASTKKRKEYLVLTCGPPSVSSAVPSGKGEDGESCSDDESSGDEENQTVCISDRHRPRKKQKVNKKGKGREWVLRKKDQMRRKGNVVPPDTKYTARKRKAHF